MVTVSETREMLSWRSREVGKDRQWARLWFTSLFTEQESKR